MTRPRITPDQRAALEAAAVAPLVRGGGAWSGHSGRTVASLCRAGLLLLRDSAGTQLGTGGDAWYDVAAQAVPSPEGWDALEPPGSVARALALGAELLDQHAAEAATHGQEPTAELPAAAYPARLEPPHPSAMGYSAAMLDPRWTPQRRQPDPAVSPAGPAAPDILSAPLVGAGEATAGQQSTAPAGVAAEASGVPSDPADSPSEAGGAPLAPVGMAPAGNKGASEPMPAPDPRGGEALGCDARSSSASPPQSWPGPGLYSDMPAEEYHALDALSSSRLRALAESVAAYLCECQEGREATRAMELGTAIHARLLEPHRALTVARCRARRGKEWETALAAAQPGELVVTEADAEVIERAVGCARANPLLTAMLMGGRAELTGLWTESVAGVEIRCRLRADRLTGRADLLDLKTTGLGVGEHGYAALMRAGTALRMAWYRRGLRRLGVQVRLVTLGLIPAAPPWTPVEVHLIPGEDLDRAELLIDEVLLPRLARHLREPARWTGLRATVAGRPAWIEHAPQPAWAWRRQEEEHDG